MRTPCDESFVPLFFCLAWRDFERRRGKRQPLLPRDPHGETRRGAAHRADVQVAQMRTKGRAERRWTGHCFALYAADGEVMGKEGFPTNSQEWRNKKPGMAE